MSEKSYPEYEARRAEDIAKRLALYSQQEETIRDDPHGKAGCFSCDWMAFGSTAAALAAEHHTSAKHQIWVIRPPLEE